MSEDHNDPSGASGVLNFATTHWTVVLAAGQQTSPQASAALEKLCRTYWYPLYVFARRKGYRPEEAKDLTQEFFSRLLAKNYLKDVQRERGKFRSFLLASMKHFLSNQRVRANRLKRGGLNRFISIDDAEAENCYQLEVQFTAESPDVYFQRRWAITVLEQALQRLREDYLQMGKSELFERLKVFLSKLPSEGEYECVAEELDMKPGTFSVAVYRFRQRYGSLVREEIAHTVTHPSEIDEEMRHLFEILNR